MSKKVKKWFNPSIETGWDKDMTPERRRGKMLLAHNGDCLSSARAMQALANVTEDKETKEKARADALYFYERHKTNKTSFKHYGKGIKLTPKMRRLPR